MKRLVPLLLSCLLGRAIFAESFEGEIGTFPVWLDLKLPDRIGPVSGSYFYKKAQDSIRLQGERDSSGLTLREFDKRGRVTGVFECRVAGDSLVGLWSSKKKPIQYRIRLSRTDPSYRKNARYKFSELITEGGTSLQEEINSSSGGGFTSKPETYVLYDRKNILSIGYEWSSMGAYPDEGIEYFLFDLTSKREISIWSEIDPAEKKELYQVLVPRVGEFLNAVRARYPDSEWSEIFHGWFYKEDSKDTSQVLDKVFSVRDTVASIDEKLVVCTLEADSVRLGTRGHGYFGFPHVIQAMDSRFEIAFSFAEFDRYLKLTSVLKNLAKKP